MGMGLGRLSGVGIFDLDGTLVDTLGAISVALNCVLERHGRKLLNQEEVKELVGRGPQTLLHRAWAKTGESASEREVGRYTQEYFLEYGRGHGGGVSLPYPGVEEGLRRLVQRGWRLGICTNKDGKTARGLVKNLGWERWIRVVESGEDSVRKPNGRPLRLALNRLRAGRGRHLFIGDSGVDRETARNAGVEGVFVGYGYGQRDGTEDRYFSTARELFSWMGRAGP